MKTIQSSIFLILFLSFTVKAQENDFQTWNTFSLNKELNKKTDISLTLGLRLRENATLYSKQFFDLNLKRNINKKVS